MAADRDDDKTFVKTVVKPAPAAGGRPPPERPAAPPPPPPPPPPPRERRPPPPPPRPREPVTMPAMQESDSANPLLQSATPLLLLGSKLREMTHPPAVEQLHQRAVAELREFEERARARGCANEQVITARYLLCTYLDESVMNTPWGSQSGWQRRSLLATFHRETWGGEKFFQILERAEQDPTRHLLLLELVHACLALGFVGKYGVEDQGYERLAELRRRLWRRIESQRGRPEGDLSIRWEGVEERANPIRTLLPPWLVGVAALCLVLMVFFGFYLALGHRASPIEARLSQIGLQGVAFAAPAPPPSAKPPPTLRQLLSAEVKAGSLDVVETADRSTVILSARMFRSASADVDAEYLPLLQSVGKAVDQVPGRILVIGHSDDQALRSMRYRDNYELSRERASSASRIVGAAMKQPSRLEWSGVGPQQPRCTPPDTTENRACNRRVEIVQLPGG